MLLALEWNSGVGGCVVDNVVDDWRMDAILNHRYTDVGLDPLTVKR